MSSTILFIAIALFLCGASNGRSISDPDNSIQTNDPKYVEARDWIKVTEAPAARVTHQIGTSLELECELAGSPPPQIQWIRGNVPLDNMDDFETNQIVGFEATPLSITRVHSRLILDHVTSSERTYTCFGRSGSQTAYATTTVHTVPSGIIGHNNKIPQNFTDLFGINNNINNNNNNNNIGGNIMTGPKKPRIILNYSVVLELIGSNVMIPCKAVGRPRPEIYWLDSNDNIVSGQDPRFKVLPTGELIITNLKWADMGGYTCVARNVMAKDSVTTFVYPLSE